MSLGVYDIDCILKSKEAQRIIAALEKIAEALEKVSSKGE